MVMRPLSIILVFSLFRFPFTVCFLVLDKEKQKEVTYHMMINAYTKPKKKENKRRKARLIDSY